MRYTTTSFQFGPEFTSPTIKNLIVYTCAISIVSSLINAVFTQLFGVSGPEDWLSLSWHGLTNYYIWQPFTSLFVHYSAGHGITFSSLITLLFQMYLLYIIGSQVLERVGRKPFLRLYLISGIIAGLASLILLRMIGHYDVLSGPSSALLAVFTVWALMYPEAELLLFFLIPVKAKWLITGMLGILLLISFSTLDFASFTMYFFGAVTGYLYGLIAWGLHMPYKGFANFEALVSKGSDKIRNLYMPKSKKEKRGEQMPKSKIYDISTGKPMMDDDSFIDTMLEKISKHGRQSLTWEERKRMDEISEKKRQDKLRKN